MRILMLGNSLTTANNLPQLLGKLTGGDICVHARGGARLAEHLNPQTRLGALTQQALVTGGPWDFVIMQEMSNGPVRFRTRFLEACARLCELARTAKAQPVLYATWAYAPTCPKLEKLGMTHEQMHEWLFDAYREAARENNALLADVGTAFFEHVDKAALYAPDGVHPSEAGTRLASHELNNVVLANAF